MGKLFGGKNKNQAKDQKKNEGGRANKPKAAAGKQAQEEKPKKGGWPW